MFALLLVQVDNLDKSQLVAEEEKVEQDDLNTHEVMATLTQLLTHMEHNSITPAVDEVGVACVCCCLLTCLITVG